MTKMSETELIDHMDHSYQRIRKHAITLLQNNVYWMPLMASTGLLNMAEQLKGDVDGIAR